MEVTPNIHDGAFFIGAMLNTAKMGDDRKGVSRRELLTFWRKPLEELKAKPEPPRPQKDPSRPPPLRPPGLMHELILVNSCERCGKCVAACPADAIFPLDGSWGAAAGTPAIVARTQPCVLCDGLQCTHVCPSGALQPVYNNRDVKMGSAVVDAGRCVAFAGQSCDLCHKACPMPETIVLEAAGIRVVEETCTGCGLCEHVCPTDPSSIRVVPRA
jgi:ferredoxin-type protein NapG